MANGDRFNVKWNIIRRRLKARTLPNQCLWTNTHYGTRDNEDRQFISKNLNT